jgi:hypothetical protein
VCVQGQPVQILVSTRQVPLALGCYDLTSAIRVSDIEEFHILVFDGRYVNCDDICIGSAFDSMKLSFLPLLSLMMVTCPLLRVSLLSIT